MRSHQIFLLSISTFDPTFTNAFNAALTEKMSIAIFAKASKQKRRERKSKISSSPDFNKLVNAEMEFCRVAHKNKKMEIV
jgi:hypothetical protein